MRRFVSCTPVSRLRRVGARLPPPRKRADALRGDLHKNSKAILREHSPVLFGFLRRSAKNAVRFVVAPPENEKSIPADGISRFVHGMGATPQPSHSRLLSPASLGSADSLLTACRLRASSTRSARQNRTGFCAKRKNPLQINECRIQNKKRTLLGAERRASKLPRYSPMAKIPAPCARYASIPIFGRGNRTGFCARGAKTRFE